MNVELITKNDLENLRHSLIEEIRTIVRPAVTDKKKWLRTREVRKILNLSPGSLQNLRIRGKLHPKKIGGTYFYSAEEVEALFK